MYTSFCVHQQPINRSLCDCQYQYEYFHWVLVRETFEIEDNEFQRRKTLTPPESIYPLNWDTHTNIFVCPENFTIQSRLYPSLSLKF